MKKLVMNRKKDGFSLVEIIIVIAIMAILIGVIALAIIPNIVKSRESKDLTTINNVLSAATIAVSNGHIETEDRVVIKLSPDDYSCPGDGEADGGPDGFKKNYDDAISGTIGLVSTNAENHPIFIGITGRLIEVIVGKSDSVGGDSSAGDLKSYAAECEYTMDEKNGEEKQLFYVSN